LTEPLRDTLEIRGRSLTFPRLPVLPFPLLTGTVLLVLILGALCTSAGSLIGLTSFRDVGYPDSAALLRVGDVVRSGRMYPDFHRPPYQLSLYAPLTYVLHAIPYALGEQIGLSHQVAVRLGVLVAFVLCLTLLFLIGRVMSSSSVGGWLAVLFAASIFPLGDWTTQIRSEFWAIAVSLAAVLIVIRSTRRQSLIAAAILAGMAPLVKQTFIAASAAVFIWLLVSRRFKNAAIWSATVCVTFLVGFGIAWWREPSMLEHLSALGDPAIDFREAFRFLVWALSQPMIPFTAFGAVLTLSTRREDALLVLTFCALSWLIGATTSLHAGGNINYFWEALLASSILGAYALCEIDGRGGLPMAASALLALVFLWACPSIVANDLRYLRDSFQKLASYQERRQRWISFTSVIAGHRILSIEPSLTVLSNAPQVPDPYLNSVLELSGRWSYAPVIAQLDAGQFDLVVVNRGYPARELSYRGVPLWNAGVREALKATYRRACVFEDFEIWLPPRSSSTLLTRLSEAGCSRENDSVSSRSSSLDQ
jgi:dolichyl-phosphate-mannose-protein mannosyltransferase